LACSERALEDESAALNRGHTFSSRLEVGVVSESRTFEDGRIFEREERMGLVGVLNSHALPSV
jgi:hypothetical protein